MIRAEPPNRAVQCVYDSVYFMKDDTPVWGALSSETRDPCLSHRGRINIHSLDSTLLIISRAPLGLDRSYVTPVKLVPDEPAHPPAHRSRIIESDERWYAEIVDLGIRSEIVKNDTALCITDHSQATAKRAERVGNGLGHKAMLKAVVTSECRLGARCLWCNWRRSNAALEL